MQLGRLDEAEALAIPARIAFPDHPRIGFVWADLAARRGDWTEAASRWLDLRQRFPAEAHCGLEAMRALTQAGRHDWVEVVAAAMRTEFPDDYSVAFYWANASDWLGNWHESVSRWEELRVRFPAEASPFVHGMRALLEAGEPVKALDLARAANVLFPLNREVASVASIIAASTGDLDMAADFHKALYEKAPGDRDAALAYVDSLVRLDRRDEASIVLRDSLNRWPGDEHLSRTLIEIALRNRDFDGALGAWRQLKESRADARALLSEIAMRFVRSWPPAEALEPLLEYLTEETDTGDRHWTPAYAGLRDHIFFHGKTIRAPVLEWLDRNEARIPMVARLIWKALAGAPLTDAEVDYAFEQYLSQARMPLVGTIFIFSSFSGDWSSMPRTFAAFERFVDKKLASPEWIREDNPLELLSYLLFASVASFDAWKRLVRAGLERLAFGSIPAGAAPETAETALASLLRAASRIEFAPDTLAAPAAIGRMGRPLNVAICVSGQLRGFERALPAWSQLGLQEHKTETFVHTWKDQGRNWSRSWAFLQGYPALWQAVATETGVEFLGKRFPSLGEAVAATITDGKNVSADRLKAFYQTDRVVLEDDNADAWKGRPNVWKMHYKIEQAHQLALASMPADTLFVRIRPDQNFGACAPIDWERVYFESARNRMLYADMPCMFIGNEGVLKMADAFLVGARDPMTVFAGVYAAQSALMARGSTFFDAPTSLVPHTSVAYSTLYQGVSARHFREIVTAGFLEATILPADRILALLIQDVGDNPAGQLERDFLDAARTFAA